MSPWAVGQAGQSEGTAARERQIVERSVPVPPDVARVVPDEQIAVRRDVDVLRTVVRRQLDALLGEPRPAETHPVHHLLPEDGAARDVGGSPHSTHEEMRLLARLLRRRLQALDPVSHTHGCLFRHVGS